MILYFSLLVATVVCVLAAMWLLRSFSNGRVQSHGTGVSGSHSDPTSHLDSSPVGRRGTAGRNSWETNDRHMDAPATTAKHRATPAPGPVAGSWRDHHRADGDYGYLGESANGSKSEARFLGGEAKLDWLGSDKSK